MALLSELRRRSRHILAPLVMLVVTVWFLYQIAQGERGILAWLKLDQEIREADSTLARTSAERAVLERRVALLSPKNLDKDLLEERVRQMLNYAHSDELVILQNGPERQQ